MQAHLYGPGPRTSDNLHALEVATYDGERFWVGNDEEAELESMIAAGGRKGEIYAQLRDLREAGLGATAFPPGGKDHGPGWEDSAVPPSRLGDYLRDLRELCDKHGLIGAMYGHFGEGCVHSRMSFDLRTAEGLAIYRTFLEEAADLVVAYGGSVSGEHGDGQQPAELLDRQFSPRIMEAMREFKRIWDPA